MKLLRILVLASAIPALVLARGGGAVAVTGRWWGWSRRAAAGLAEAAHVGGGGFSGGGAARVGGSYGGRGSRRRRIARSRSRRLRRIRRVPRRLRLRRLWLPWSTATADMVSAWASDSGAGRITATPCRTATIRIYDPVLRGSLRLQFAITIPSVLLRAGTRLSTTRACRLTNSPRLSSIQYARLRLRPLSRSAEHCSEQRARLLPDRVHRSLHPRRDRVSRGRRYASTGPRGSMKRCRLRCRRSTACSASRSTATGTSTSGCRNRAPLGPRSEWVAPLPGPATRRIARIVVPPPHVNKPSLLDRLKAGIQKTRAGLMEKIEDAVSGRKEIDADVLEELEYALITADIGSRTTAEILERIRQRVERHLVSDSAQLKTLIKEHLLEILEATERPPAARRRAARRSSWWSA